jgi:hypothetical protein
VTPAWTCAVTARHRGGDLGGETPAEPYLGVPSPVRGTTGDAAVDCYLADIQRLLYSRISPYRAAPACSATSRRCLELEGDRLAKEVQPRLRGSPLVLRRGDRVIMTIGVAVARPYGLGNSRPVNPGMRKSVTTILWTSGSKRQAIALVHCDVRLMSNSSTNSAKMSGSAAHCHEHLHFFPVNFSSRRGVGWPTEYHRDPSSSSKWTVAGRPEGPEDAFEAP